MEYEQKILRSAVVDSLRSKVSKLQGLEDYCKAGLSFTEDEVWPLRVELDENVPELLPGQEDDVLNACRLHAYLSELDETQASDKRLWTYLAHVPFRGYVQGRWPLPVTEEEISASTDAKRKASSSILLHWFVNGNDSRALKRHALARLWWVAHLTVAPWEWGAEFEVLREDDRYAYTKFVLANETLYTEVFERTFGNNRVIRMAILRYLREHPEHIGRKYLRPIMKELVLLSGVKRLAILSFGEVCDTVSEVAADIAGRVDSQS